METNEPGVQVTENGGPNFGRGADGTAGEGGAKLSTPPRTPTRLNSGREATQNDNGSNRQGRQICG
jgi:hypothetical protein